MNWVGGSLSRHRRGKGWKEDLANQEQYFAKARSWRREQAKTTPVVLSAANFIPNYSAASTAAARMVRPSSPPSLPVPLDTCGNPKCSAILVSPSQNLQQDAAEQPSYAVPPSQTSGSAVFNNQSTKDNLVGTSVPEADRQRFLKEDDFMQSKLPKLSMAKPAQKRGHSAAARQVVGQHRRQSAIPTSHREIRPNVGDRRGSRKRRLSQITSPPVDTTIRIRVGSKSYQWSEAGNSIRDPTYNNNSLPSRSADESRCIASTTGNTSHVIDKSFSGLSSSPIGPSPWFSPESSRPAHRRKFSDPTKHLNRAGSAISQCPMTVYTDTLSPPVRPPAMSATSSVSSMTVEVGNSQESQKFAINEEDIWRAWLNPDMPEFRVPKRQQDITADAIRRPLPTPVPRGLAIATLPIQADCDSALQEPSVKLQRRFGGWP